jgi:hypothetical protein
LLRRAIFLIKGKITALIIIMTSMTAIIDGPAAKSIRSEASSPSMQPIRPKSQPKAILESAPREQIMAVEAGMVRSENTISTPAIFTDEVTTIPKVA